MEQSTVRLIAHSLAGAVKSGEVDVNDSMAVLDFAVSLTSVMTPDRDASELDPLSLYVGSVMAFAAVELEAGEGS